jgi:hypothetical protein
VSDHRFDGGLVDHLDVEAMVFDVATRVFGRDPALGRSA